MKPKGDQRVVVTLGFAIMRRLSLTFALVVAVSCGGNVVDGPTASRPPSCRRTPGAGNDCGVDGKQDCCASASIAGGSFNRYNDKEYPATVSSFRMDVYEVTVGRFRAFLDAGAHPKVPGSGWNAEWDRFLPTTTEEFSREVSCADFPVDSKYVVWTATPGPNERAAMNCIAWHEAFAFCAWDVGRLATETEWLYNAVGGSEQRRYPWGTQAADTTRVVLSDTPNGAFVTVGSVPAGATRWGVMDIGGSRAEHVRDGWRESSILPEIPKTCVDCIVMNQSDEKYLGYRDLWFNGLAEEAHLPGELKQFGANGAGARGAIFGIRCVRD